MRRRVAVLAVIGLCGGLSGCDGDDTAERFITEVAGPFGAVAVGDRVWVTSAGAVVASATLRDRPSSMAVTSTRLVFANGFDDSITVLDRSELVSAA